MGRAVGVGDGVGAGVGVAVGVAVTRDTAEDALGAADPAPPQEPRTSASTIARRLS